MRTYNPGKLIKYDLLVHAVTESTSGYTGNSEIYSGEGKKLLSSISRSLGKCFLKILVHKID
jgi:hypothetical protein